MDMAEILLPALLFLIAGVGIGYASWNVPLMRLRRRHDELVAEHARLAADLAAARARGEAHDGVAGELDTARTERERALTDAAGLRARVAELEPLRAEAARAGRLEADLAALRAEQAERDRASDEQRAALIAQGEALKAEFERLAAAALKGTQGQFLEAAEVALKRQREEADKGLAANKAALAELLTPVADTLRRYEDGLKAVETAREQAYGSLREQLTAVAAGQAAVQQEAGRLVTALRSSGRTAGSWGEQQLKNVLEMAGLREGIDFTLQTSAATEAGARRPDAIINLPGGRQLIVDSKCSLIDLQAAAGADEAARREAVLRHAACVKAHAKGLAEKAYWREFGQSADFVVMFLPGESFLSAALESDTGLLDWAFGNRILLAGPINLLAIAKTVALVWRQERLAKEAEAIGKLGADLYAAIAVMAEHVDAVGEGLTKALGAHNKMVGSLEQNVLPKARRLPELGVDRGKKPLPDLAPVAVERRLPVAPELRLVGAAD